MGRYILLISLLLPLVGHAQCKALRKKKDKATGNLTIMTDPKEPVSMLKVFQNETPTYYLKVCAPASTASEQKGIFVMVSEKTLYKWPEERISVKPERHRLWRDKDLTASATISLTVDQLKLLAANRISDYELGEFGWSVPEDSGELFRRQVGCLVNTQPKKKKD